MRSRSRGGTFGAERTWKAASVVNLGHGRLARLNLEKTSANTSVPSVQLGSVSGAFGHLLSIPGKAVYAERASLAGNAHGELLFAWISADSHGGHREAWASVRPRGGRFGRPRLISASGGAAQVNAAVGPQGDMATAFPDTHGNMVAAVRRHGQRWTPARSVGAAAGGSENDVTPFVAEDGQVVIAWYETQLCEGGCENPGYVRVAALPAGRSKFRPEQILEKDEIGLQAAPIGASLAPSVIQSRGRSPMIIFLARGPNASQTTGFTPTLVEVAISRGDVFATPQTISEAGQEASGVRAAAGREGALVTWVREEPPYYDYGTVIAARVTSTGQTSAPEQVASEQGALAALPAFDPASTWPANPIAPWTVAWINHPAGEATTGEAGMVIRVSSPLCPVPSLAPQALQADGTCTGA